MVVQKRRAGEAQMRDSPEGELIMKSLSAGAERRILLPFYPSCIGKRAIYGCDHGSEVGTVHSERNGGGPVPRGNRRKQ